MIRIFITLIIGSLALANSYAQAPAKKSLDHAEFDTWNTIENPMISHDGRWVVYQVKPGEGDCTLHVYDGNSGKEQTFARGEGAKISADSRFVVFEIKPFDDTITAQRRRKVKKDDLPKDSLAILELATGKVTKVADIQSFQLPENWGGWLAYLKEPESAGKMDKDKDGSDDKKEAPKGKSKEKKENKENGSKLVIRNLATGQETTVAFVKSYTHSKEGAKFMLASSGSDSTFEAGVYVFDANKNALIPILTKKGEYKNLTFDEKGTQAAFVADFESEKLPVKPYELYFWKEGNSEAKQIADNTSAFLPKEWRISENANLNFSKDGSKLIFGIAPKPILQDTTLLDDEIVNVEVWAYNDPVLPTIQNVQLEREKKRSYECIYYPANGKIIQIATPDVPEVQFGNEGAAPYAMGYNDKPYGVESTWEWWNKKDVYLIDVKSGEQKLVGKGIEGLGGFGGSSGLSPAGKYVFWFSDLDTAWVAYAIEKGSKQQLTDNKKVSFSDELDDHPDNPNSYGMAGWLKDDAAMLVYDRYDIWKIDPTGAQAPVKLTNGRKDQIRIRYIRTDFEKRYIDPNEKILVSTFDENSKKDGYAWFDLSNNTLTQLQFGEYNYSNRPLKAKNADKWVFTRENFQTFPNLLYSNDLKTFKQISDANPQQKNYLWGTAELVHWTSLDGDVLDGMLFKPENFDPKKKYPMIVNFYERSSDGLYSHRAPAPPRSVINFTFYTSRGYVVFVPDIPYKIGFPGESCYNAVIPGVTSLIDKGFIDRDRIGVQGHSWGGYQIAYLVTRTNIFRCAESGAPVVNMFSAYGGIRWGSGMSRSAQYEHTQSRIGGSIWEYPLRYLENSPLFFADKIETPLLILHNDKDDAVPWYQGIEFYIALRRLSKPAWLLDYNGEPHGIMKRQNRMDFNRRMQQFFDHYLKDAPTPQWMEHGVPAIAKGIQQGFELSTEAIGNNATQEMKKSGGNK